MSKQARGDLVFQRACLIAMAVVLGIARADAGQPAGLQTGPLKLEFTSAGGFHRVLLDGRAIALSGSGGFTCMEVESDPSVGGVVVYRNGFEKGAPPWALVPDRRTGAPRPVSLSEAGNTFLRVGHSGQFGHGFAPSEPIAALPGTRCRISWRGRVPDDRSSFIVYIRVFDAKGKDITDQAAAPRSWTYSIYSRTHYRYPIIPSKVNVWEELTLDYRVPEEASAILPAFCSGGELPPMSTM